MDFSQFISQFNSVTVCANSEYDGNITPVTIHEINAHLFQLNFTVFYDFWRWKSSFDGENKSLKTLHHEQQTHVLNCY